mmetsp:Transcript_16264/g.48725  ORF Transcript_16264/g.48725 Transcript_16264/m.48725 type:complete len:234 (+) Transcript_16264:471-1172(+)
MSPPPAEASNAAAASNAERGEAAPAAAAPAAPTAVFGTAEEEVVRLTRVDNMSYYAVLKVEPDNLSALKRNYFKLSRLVHPDKCSHPESGKAMAVVSTAYDVLSTPMKKKLYDAYATQEKPEDMSYAQWEAQQVEIPMWLQRVLKVPCGGCFLLMFLVPVLIIVLILFGVVWLLCLPFRLLLRCCGAKTLTDEEMAVKMAEARARQEAEEAAAARSSTAGTTSAGAAPTAMPT